MILVTGGTGMLGAHLLFQLVNSGESIRATYRSEKSFQKVKKVFGYYTADVDEFFSKIDWIKADVSNLPSLENAFFDVQKVYHIAAIVSFDEADAKEMRLVNIHGTANVVNLCVAHKVKKLCFVSSIAAIAKTVQKPLIDENDEFNLISNNYSYAITKYGAEMEVWRGAQEGVDVFIVNPGVILGAGFWNENSGKLFTMAYKETPLYTEGITGFVGVDDVVSILIKGMNSTIKNERFVLVSENISFKKLFFSMADTFGKKRPKIKVTKFIAALGWRLSWLKSKLTGGQHTFTKHTAGSINNKYYYDNSKVKEFLQFEFQTMDKVVQTISQQFLNDKKASKK